jgi:hypothetical protein
VKFTSHHIYSACPPRSYCSRMHQLVVCILHCFNGDLNDGFQMLCEVLSQRVKPYPHLVEPYAASVSTISSPHHAVSSPNCAVSILIQAGPNTTRTTTSFPQHLCSLGTILTPRLTYGASSLTCMPRHGRVTPIACRVCASSQPRHTYHIPLQCRVRRVGTSPVCLA